MHQVGRDLYGGSVANDKSMVSCQKDPSPRDQQPGFDHESKL